ncbi:MAG: L-threonylcarbamoyladenylate synthase, partial [Holophaga sp.]|nr:L-threonylcarbamoyladenylate synthase [Holophaga sp.]
MSVETGPETEAISEATLESIRNAARTIREGGVVAFPTETVYGMGANALDPKAVARVFELKGRPRFDPIIVHVPGLHAAQALTSIFPWKALLLAERFWPGPLTLVLEKAACIPDIVTAGLPRVGLRVPEHPIALALLREAKVPIAAPSANAFGKVSPTTAQHVERSFGHAIQVLDGGPCAYGLESTVVLVPSDGHAPVLLRPG